MSNVIVSVGYICPICKQRIAVLRSSDPIPKATDVIQSECKCGFGRPISIGEVLFLDVWRETTA